MGGGRRGDRAIASSLSRVVRVAYLAAAIPASLLAVSSYFAYTTGGFDFEAATAQGVDVTYYRLRWDDGSTWIGRAVQPIPRPDRPLDWFDPGGTPLAAPTRPAHRGLWNDLGFWWVGRPDADPYVAARYPGATASAWWACPSWLVLLAIWQWPLRRLSRRVHRDGGRPPTSSPTTG